MAVVNDSTISSSASCKAASILSFKGTKNEQPAITTAITKQSGLRALFKRVLPQQQRIASDDICPRVHKRMSETGMMAAVYTQIAVVVAL
jgi:hypothetical protein